MRNSPLAFIAILGGMAMASHTAAMQLDTENLQQPPSKYSPKGKGRNNRRGKGTVTPPKKRSNRLTISKRVRRAHRKAAR